MVREPQRLYLKDIDCPEEWRQSLESIIPPSLFYLNEHPKPYTGPGSKYSDMPPYPRTKADKPIAKAGDLMSSLPPDMQAKNLMCYIGHEGTYTPAHQEMCGSLSQNLMVEASDGSPEYGKTTIPGSSIWLMTETQDRHIVSEYWRSKLGHDIDLENHFAQLQAWKKAPFTTYVVEQTPGDLVLVPPLAAHQVWNRGTRTMKVAWNRTTVETLQWALDEELPRARAICREEQYKNKAIILYTLQKYSTLLLQDPGKMHPGVDSLWEDFEFLFGMFTDILLSESFSETMPKEDKVEYLEFSSDVTCSYCRCNIFNRFLTCTKCVDGTETYDICLDCYVFGRSCRCISQLVWVEQFHWKDLVTRHEKWRRQIMRRNEKQGNGMDHLPLSAVRARETQKSVAQICQEQLLVRPWVDCKKSEPEEAEETLSESDESEEVKNRRSAKRRKVSKASKNQKNNKSNKNNKNKMKPEDTGRCHICKPGPIWKLKKCSTCDSQYCYGCLYRLFDFDPVKAMQGGFWGCPKCEKVCSCSNCNRRDKLTNAYEPKKLLLGHETLKFADERSVESLVDLRRSNIHWMKKFRRTKNNFHGDDRRLEQLRCEAEKARMALDETRNTNVEEAIEQSDAFAIDPALESPVQMKPTQSIPHEGYEQNGMYFNHARETVAQMDEASIIREEFEPMIDFPVDPALGLHDTFMAIDPALGCA